ncbi:DUF692 family multinuclear iron-containing protein [Thalassotalea euphylliae]|uniref:DUF692 domain-containing protein n=1 Tax=Thalassotalea euphylliae TaxID=1655234 RepID=UPI00363F0B1A
MSIDNQQTQHTLPLVGVGLRDAHYQDALTSSFSVDFVEIHAENFFAPGGITQALLADIIDKFSVSLHATSLGLGSIEPVPASHLERFKSLVDQINPILVSDHACFSWGQINDVTVHAGDLLPVPFNDESIALMQLNTSRIENAIGRKVLIENLSAYLTPPNSTLSEMGFLKRLHEATGNQLLLDLNNLMVNAVNSKAAEPLATALQWLEEIPASAVGEIHLAGCSPIGETGVMIDDHSQPVSDEVWALYSAALSRFGPVPTLIEWDMDLPSWEALCAQADTAKAVAKEVFECH